MRPKLPHPDLRPADEPAIPDSAKAGSVQRSIAQRYAVAIFAVLLAVGIRWLLDPWLGNSLRFALLYGAVAVAAWVGRWRAATLAALIGYFLVAFLFLAPRNTFTFDSEVAITLSGYAVVCAMFIFVLEQMHRERDRSAREMAKEGRTREALRQSEDRFRRMADAAPVLIWICDTNKLCTWFNKSWLDFVGRTMQEEVGRGWLENLHPDEAAQGNDDFVAAFAAHQPFSMEYRLRRADGQYRWILDHATPLYGPDNEFTGYIGSCIDITDRRASEELSREKHAALETIINHTPFMLTRCSRDLRYLFVSRGYARMLGRTPEEIVGKPIAEVVGEVGLATMEPHIEKVLRGEVVEYEEDVHFSGVGHRSLQVVYRPEQNESGEVTGWIASVLDVTDRKRAEVGLRESARIQGALYRLVERRVQVETVHQIYDSALDAIFAALHCDRASILLFDKNDVMRFVAWRGLSDDYRKAVEGHSPWKPSDTEAKPFAIDDVAKSSLDENLRETITREGIGGCAFIPLTANGRVIGKFMVYTNQAHSFTPEEIEVCLTIARQMSLGIQHKGAEEMLRRSEERLRLATQTGKIGLWEWDLADNRVVWTDSLYAIHGVTEKEFDGTIEAFTKLIHPEDREFVGKAIERTLREGAPYELTFRAVRPQDDRTIWVFTNAVAVRSGERVVRMAGATADITDLKQIESALQRAKLEAEEANRTKDQFLAMLSHELRTPLTPVLMATTSLEMDPTLPDALREQFSMMRRNIELEARLIDDLLDITRIAQGKLELHQEAVDIHLSIENALHISAPDLHSKHLRIKKQFDAVEHFSSADAARLQEVFWNLLRNAVKFTPDRGEIHILTRNDGSDRIVVEISDNGTGIEPELLPRIFDAFAQGERAIRQRQGGLGLGLAISKKIVDMHGGTITVRSPGRLNGATFLITLQVSEKAAPRRTKPGATRRTPAGAGARILVVEDHSDTADVLRRVLQSTGYTVEHCGTVSDACATCGRQKFDIVISDIGLPDGSGLDLMRHLQETYEMKGIALSGFGTREDVAASQAAGFAMHLTKPVDLDALRSAIAKTLGAVPKYSTPPRAETSA